MGTEHVWFQRRYPGEHVHVHERITKALCEQGDAGAGQAVLWNVRKWEPPGHPGLRDVDAPAA